LRLSRAGYHHLTASFSNLPQQWENFHKLEVYFEWSHYLNTQQHWKSKFQFTCNRTWLSLTVRQAHWRQCPPWIPALAQWRRSVDGQRWLVRSASWTVPEMPKKNCNRSPLIFKQIKIKCALYVASILTSEHI
jgi:hypothetical protein